MMLPVIKPVRARYRERLKNLAKLELTADRVSAFSQLFHT